MAGVCGRLWGERTERLLYANLKFLLSYMLIKQRLQNSSLHLPSSFDEGYTPTEGEGDGVRKAQFIVDLQPKTQVEDCSYMEAAGSGSGVRAQEAL